MQTKKISMSPRVYVEGQSLKPTVVENPYHQEDYYLEELKGRKTQKAYKLSFAKKLINLLSESSTLRSAERNKTLVSKLKEVWEANQEKNLKYEVVLIMGFVDHKESTLFLMDVYNQEVKNKDEKMKAYCVDSLLVHMQIMNEKIETEKDEKLQAKYKKAITKIEAFFEANEIDAD
jgi:mRNA-degrading endonuclease YafQ of YafQ-DinJ toxin-antitoxin module